jgi:hypothetical protein
MMSLTSTTADLRRSIGASIPQIINLLEDNSAFVRAASAAALATFSEQGMYHAWTCTGPLTTITAEFQGLIETSIPHIVSLLKHEKSTVCAMAVLSKLSARGM